jgi:hypothetical protein
MSPAIDATWDVEANDPRARHRDERHHQGDTMEAMLLCNTRLAIIETGSLNVMCLACEMEQWLDVEPGEAIACACGSRLVLIDGVTLAEWNRLRAN